MKINLISPKRKNNKKIYVIMYEPRDSYMNEDNIPVIAFKTLKQAQLYCNSRNFEFQSIAITGGDDQTYDNYVIENDYRDYIVTVSDLRLAFLEARSTIKNGQDIFESIKYILPFRVKTLMLY